MIFGIKEKSIFLSQTMSFWLSQIYLYDLTAFVVQDHKYKTNFRLDIEKNSHIKY